MPVVEFIYLARQGLPVKDIRQAISKNYELDFTIASIRQKYQRTERALHSVPQAIVAALEATSFEDAIRLAVSLVRDTDTHGPQHLQEICIHQWKWRVSQLN